MCVVVAVTRFFIVNASREAILRLEALCLYHHPAVLMSLASISITRLERMFGGHVNRQTLPRVLIDYCETV